MYYFAVYEGYCKANYKSAWLYRGVTQPPVYRAEHLTPAIGGGTHEGSKERDPAL